MKKFLLAILLTPCIVSGANTIQPKVYKNKKLERLVFSLATVPGAKCISRIKASALEIPEHWECRVKEFFAEEVTDGMDHNANLLVEVSSSTTEQGPRRLVLGTAEMASDRKSGEFHLFVTSLDGELIKALATYGKFDEKGEPVQGSGIDVPQDLKDKEIRSKFKHELEFWLDGKYRKKPKKS